MLLAVKIKSNTVRIEQKNKMTRMSNRLVLFLLSNISYKKNATFYLFSINSFCPTALPLDYTKRTIYKIVEPSQGENTPHKKVLTFQYFFPSSKTKRQYGLYGSKSTISTEVEVLSYST